MERELWRWITWGLKRLPRRWPTRGVYDNRAVLAVLLWSALHDRPICWACRRSSWPVQAWRRSLPNQSTMSRRLRDPNLQRDLQRLGAVLQRRLPQPDATLIVDGKPLPVSGFTTDPQAANGWASSGYARGYKLHALIDQARQVLAWEVRPMNDSEQAVACELVKRAAALRPLAAETRLLADANYDSRHLYAAASEQNVRLIAPRRAPGTGLDKNRSCHPHRLDAIAMLENDARRAQHFKARRSTIERFFGALATLGGGLCALPPWARRLHRVSAWVGAKLVLYTARSVCRNDAVGA